MIVTDDPRKLRETPYTRDNLTSRARKMRQPKTLHQYLVWFLTGWEAETPEAMHASGVWRARSPRVNADGDPTEQVPTEELGGSLLGSPRDAEPFRQLIDNSPQQTAVETLAEYEGSERPFYVRPMRAALERMAGRGAPDRPSALMAGYLREVAQGADLMEAARRRGCYNDHIAQEYAQVALMRLWCSWSAEPEARAV